MVCGKIVVMNDLAERGKAGDAQDPAFLFEVLE
jgi:hypothetical protein